MRNRIRLLTIAAACAIAVALTVAVTRADEIGVSCDPVSYPHPLTYNLYRSGTLTGAAFSIDDAGTPGDPSDDRVSFLLTGLVGDCLVEPYTITAVGHPPTVPAGLESVPSAPISSMPRPLIADVIFDQDGVHTILGDNYPANVEVSVDGVPVDSLNVDRVSCQVVKIPTTQGTPTSITVTHPGLTPFVWLLPAPVAPSNLSVN